MIVFLERADADKVFSMMGKTLYYFWQKALPCFTGLDFLMKKAYYPYPACRRSLKRETDFAFFTEAGMKNLFFMRRGIIMEIVLMKD